MPCHSIPHWHSQSGSEFRSHAAGDVCFFNWHCASDAGISAGAERRNRRSGVFQVLQHSKSSPDTNGVFRGDCRHSDLYLYRIYEAVKLRCHSGVGAWNHSRRPVLRFHGYAHLSSYRKHSHRIYAAAAGTMRLISVWGQNWEAFTCSLWSQAATQQSCGCSLQDY